MRLVANLFEYKHEKCHFCRNSCLGTRPYSIDQGPGFCRKSCMPKSKKTLRKTILHKEIMFECYTGTN